MIIMLAMTTTTMTMTTTMITLKTTTTTTTTTTTPCWNCGKWIFVELLFVGKKDRRRKPRKRWHRQNGGSGGGGGGGGGGGEERGVGCGGAFWKLGKVYWAMIYQMCPSVPSSGRNFTGYLVIMIVYQRKCFGFFYESNKPYAVTWMIMRFSYCINIRIWLNQLLLISFFKSVTQGGHTDHGDEE